MEFQIRNRTNLYRFGVAIAATLLGILLQFILNPYIGGVRFLIVWPVAFSVMAVAGLGPACVSILLSAVTAELYFIPVNSVGGVDPADHIKTVIYIASSLAVAWLINRNQQREKGYIKRLADLEERERRRVEGELKRSEDEFRAIFESAPVGMNEVDLATGFFLRVNPQMALITGYSAEELLKTGISDLTHPEDNAADRELIRKLVSGEMQVYDNEKRYVRKDGEVIWVRAKASPIRNAEGLAISSIGILQDVTDRKTAELSLRESQEQLRSAKEQAEQASQLKSAFLANMSHEIRTPMTAVLGFAELLRDPELSRIEREDAIERIARGGHTLLKLIDDILDISRIEANKIKIERARFSPLELAIEVTSLWRLQAERKGIALKFHTDPSVPDWATCDAARLRQVMSNLIGNAVKFTSEGEVRVFLKSDRDRFLVLEVKDSGIGIRPEDQSKLFKPFAQGDESITRKFGGSGLGLALSRRLCEELGGGLVLKSSALGFGSTFVGTIEASPFGGGPLKEPALPEVIHSP